MVKESIATLDRLVVALGRARAAREPGAASLVTLASIERTVVATRDYLRDEMLLLDGSRHSARFATLTKLWQQTAREVEALDPTGPDRTRVKAEGWAAASRWKKLEKPAGLALLPPTLAHCEWLLVCLTKDQR